MIKLSEKQIQQQLLYYLHIIPAVKFFWRNNTGAVKMQYKGKDRFIRFGEAGLSDILGIMEDGRMLAVEVKTEVEFNYLMNNYKIIKDGSKEKWTKRDQHLQKQIEFIDAINGANGVSFFCCELSQLIKVFELNGYIKKSF